MNRRSFIKNILGSAPLLGASALYDTNALANTSISKFGTQTEIIELSYPDLPEDLIDYRIGFITDLHLGGWMPDEHITEALEILKYANCNLLLVGGDLIWVPDSPIKGIDDFRNNKYISDTDEKTAQLVFSGLSGILKQFNFRDGSYTVLGNHDRWSSNDAYQELELSKSTKVLMNQHVKINVGSSYLNIFGTEDYWTGIPDVPNFNKDQNSFNILLTHNPDFVSYALHQKNLEFHLSLSGHTHGGQVKLPLIGALGYNITDLRYKEGLVDYGKTKHYTSRGLGVVEVPFRYNCPAEVTIINLKKS